MEYNTIEFETNLNNKLKSEFFCHIVPAWEQHEVGERYIVRLDGRFYCYADLIKSTNLTLEQAGEFGFHIISGQGKAAQDSFIDEMSNQHSKNPDWLGAKNTRVNILFFKKYIQISLFENAPDIPDSSKNS